MRLGVITRVSPWADGNRTRENVRGRQVVLKGRALLRREPPAVLPAMEMPHETALNVPGNPVSKDVVVHPAADVDRVDLHVAVVREHRAHVPRRGVDKVRPPQEKARLQRRDLSRSRHGTAGRDGWERGAVTASGAGTGAGCSALITSA